MKFSDFIKENLQTKAIDLDDFLSSLKNDGTFAKDASHLSVGNNTINLHNVETPDGETNQITSIVGMPQRLNGSFYCRSCPLTTLKGGPHTVGEVYEVDDCKLTSLEGAPREVGGYFSVSKNRLTSLKGVHKQIKKMNGTFYASRNPIKSHVLGLLLIEGLDIVDIDPLPVKDILNKYLPNTRGNDAVLDCQNELIDAGYDDFAQL